MDENNVDEVRFLWDGGEVTLLVWRQWGLYWLETKHAVFDIWSLAVLLTRETAEDFRKLD